MPKRTAARALAHAAQQPTPLLLHPVHTKRLRQEPARSREPVVKPGATRLSKAAAPLISANVTCLELEAHSIDEIRKIIAGIPPNSLVVSDIDNTLLEPAQLIGSDQWFEAQMTHNIKKHKDPKKGVDVTVDEYNLVHTHSEVKPVESETVKFTREILEKHGLIALTTRGVELKEATFRQLQSVGLQFRLDQNDREHEIYLSRILPDCPSSHALNGVIFAGGRPKGLCLKQYLECMQVDSTNCPLLVFIDDKKRHVTNIAATARELGIPCISIHYRHLDHKIDNVDLRIGEVQLAMLRQFGKLIPDALAANFVRDLEAHGVVLDTAESHKEHVARTRHRATPKP